MRGVSYLAAAIGAIAPLAAAVDDWMGCDYRPFCTTHRKYLLEQLESPSAAMDFSMDVDTLMFDGSSMSAKLKRNDTK